MSKKEIKRQLILNLPYLVIGLLATNIGEAWRLAEGADISAKLMAFFITVSQAFANPMGIRLRFLIPSISKSP